ncbi:MAG: hypothetical protein HYR97_03305 [Candidatus Melainabacteria bacterium]|nr:hypothetical protein [Candidatus Melainabacteria bacterium]
MYNKTIKNIFKSDFLFIFLVALSIFVFFSHTLNYQWKFFDEDIIFRETVLPIPISFKEYIETLKMLGTNHYFESTNPLYSNISNIRGNSLWLIITMFILFIFKASALNYHLFMLVLHICNAIVLFAILRSLVIQAGGTGREGPRADSSGGLPVGDRTRVVFLLTLIWAFHPVNIEPVLFGTNFGILITFFFLFVLFYYFQKIELPVKNYTVHFLFVFITYLVAFSLHEYAFVLPIILFTYLLWKDIVIENKPRKVAVAHTLRLLLPILVVFLCYTFYFFSSEIQRTYPSSNFFLTLERVLWLAPQIFFHYIKLMFFPLKLSIDHASLVTISDSYFNFYSVSAFVLMFGLLATCLFFLLTKNKNAYIQTASLGTVIFFISMLPYLHIISPVYNIASERYLYFPLFILIFFAAKLIFEIQLRHPNIKNLMIPILLIALLAYSTRAYIRTFDWRDTATLLTASINSTENYMYKGLRQHMIAVALKELHNETPPGLLSNLNNVALGYLYKAMKQLEVKNQTNVPNILKFYGLDPITLQAKNAYLIAHTKYDIDNDPASASNLLTTYFNNIKITDSHIVDFYYKVLFKSGQVDKAEELLKTYLAQKKISHVVLVAYSDLIEYKYHDLNKTKEYLLKSFKYFPYDISTLFGLKRIYSIFNDKEKYAYFSYLYALRTHDPQAFKDAALIYIALDKRHTAKNILEIMTSRFPKTTELAEIKNAYLTKFGNINT